MSDGLHPWWAGKTLHVGNQTLKNKGTITGCRREDERIIFKTHEGEFTFHDCPKTMLDGSVQYRGLMSPRFCLVK